MTEVQARWEDVKAASYCDSVRDGTHESPKLLEEGRFLITSKNIRDGRIILETANHISEQDFEDISRRSKVDQWDVLFTMIGTVGEVCLVREPEPSFAIKNIGLFKVGDELKAKWLYYWLRSPMTQAAVRQASRGTSQQYMPLEELRNFPVRIPTKPDVMHKIVDVVSAYDDLIETNRQRIALLEEAARLIYREWFVHFRFPGHEQVKIFDGLPEGWDRVPVSSVCSTYDDGDWLETKDQGGSDYRILQISNIGRNSFVETGKWRYITEETFRRLNCHEVVPGDILASRMPRPIGRGWMVTPMLFRMVTAVDVTIVRANQSRVEPYLLLYHINSDQNIGRCEANATGATRPRISRKNMGNLPITLPPMELQRQFAKIASEHNRLRDNLFKQNENLAQARDLLLPRLMNGEIAV